MRHGSCPQRPGQPIQLNDQVPLLMLSNSFSAASIWLALSVTAERVLVISRPLRAQLPFRFLCLRLVRTARTVVTL